MCRLGQVWIRKYKPEPDPNRKNVLKTNHDRKLPKVKLGLKNVY